MATMVEPMFLAIDKDQSGACMACAWHVHSSTAAAARRSTFVELLELYLLWLYSLQARSPF